MGYAVPMKLMVMMRGVDVDEPRRLSGSDKRSTYETHSAKHVRRSTFPKTKDSFRGDETCTAEVEDAERETSKNLVQHCVVLNNRANLQMNLAL